MRTAERGRGRGQNITATFSQIQRTLTINIIGNGTVNASPPGPTYNDGTVVTLTAVPGPGWAFVNWTGATNTNANPTNITMDADKTVTASFADVQAPSVQVVFPNCGEFILVGGDIKILWNATDNDAIVKLDIYVTRDNGATYTPIALNVPNTGSYVWNVPPPGTNVDATPVFSAKILILAYDNAFNQGSDDSDCPFAIHDIATAVVVTKLEAISIDMGVQLKWAVTGSALFRTFELERSDTRRGRGRSWRVRTW
jgi:hypothetical protein